MSTNVRIIHMHIESARGKPRCLLSRCSSTAATAAVDKVVMTRSHESVWPVLAIEHSQTRRKRRALELSSSQSPRDPCEEGSGMRADECMHQVAVDARITGTA